MKIWNPQKNAFEQEAESSSEQNIIVVPWTRFQQTYASRNCLRYTDRLDDVNSLELTFRCIAEHKSKTGFLSERVYPVHLQPLADKAQCEIFSMGDMFAVGMNFLVSQRTSLAFAFFENAFQLLKSFLSTTFIDVIENTISQIVWVLYYAQARKGHDVIQLFLKYIISHATISGGAAHPIVIVSRYLHNISTEALPPVLQHLNLTMGSIGYKDCEPQNAWDIKMDLFCHRSEYGADGYYLVDAERTYYELLDGLEAQFRSDALLMRRTYQNLSLIMARQYVHHGNFAEAAMTLDDAVDHYNEWLSNGYVGTYPPSAPLSIRYLIERLGVLGEALAGQGEYSLAYAKFELGLDACEKFYAHDQVVGLTILQKYLICLAEQNQQDKVHYVEGLIQNALASDRLDMRNDRDRFAENITTDEG